MKLKIRHVLFFLALIAIGVLIMKNIGRFTEFVQIIGHVNVFIILLIIPVRYFSYYCNTRYFASFFALFDEKVEHRSLFRNVITMNFVNTVFPSAGLSGISYIARSLRKDVDPHTTTIAQIFWQVFTIIGYFLLLVVAFIFLFASSSVSRIGARIILLFILGVLAVGLAGLIVIVSRATTEAFLYWATRPANVVLKLIKRNSLSKDKIIAFLDDFYGAIRHMNKHRDRVRSPIGWTMAGLFFEVASVYSVFLAFGKLVNPGVVIAGYALALLFSTASLFSAGVGIYEATMVGTFVALGQPFGLSFSVVVVYRTIALWLFLPIGLYFYKKASLDAQE